VFHPIIYSRLCNFSFVFVLKLLSKILFHVISFSFFISATEMDLGECHNTFFDEYDTYIKTEQVTVDNCASIEQDKDICASIYSIANYYKVLKAPVDHSGYSIVVCCKKYPSKSFLRNSVWRIWCFSFLLFLLYKVWYCFVYRSICLYTISFLFIKFISKMKCYLIKAALIALVFCQLLTYNKCMVS